MGTRISEIPVIVALLAFLAINYALGYWLGFGLTGSVLIAFAIAFVLPCVSMLGFMLIRPDGAGPKGTRASSDVYGDCPYRS